MNIDKLPTRVRRVLESGALHVILFGGLAACIWVAVKTHHMAGLSLEARAAPEEAEETSSEVTR